MTSHRPIENPDRAQHTNRSSSQFSIRAMMIATGVVAVLCCIFFTFPGWVSTLFLLIATLLFMPATLAALIYGTGQTRAFAVGASPAMFITMIWCTGLAGPGLPFYDFGRDGFQSKVFCALTIFVVVASGFVAQAVRWWCLRTANLNSITRL